MTEQGLLIFGAGAHARECALIALDSGHERRLMKFCVDQAYLGARELAGIEVLTLSEAANLLVNYEAIIAIGHPAARSQARDRLAAAGFRFTRLVSPFTRIAEDTRLDEGVVVFPGAVVSTGVHLGEHVHVNAHAGISHDCVVGSFTTISPGATICGHVEIGDHVFFGAGATAVNGTQAKPLRIGRRAIVAAGACVIADVDDGERVRGLPARPFGQPSGA